MVEAPPSYGKPQFPVPLAGAISAWLGRQDRHANILTIYVRGFTADHLRLVNQISHALVAWKGTTPKKSSGAGADFKST